MRAAALTTTPRPALHARGLLVPALAGLALRLLLAAVVPLQPVWDGVIYERAADDLANGRGFTQAALDPALPYTPTAFYPVGFPAALAPLRWFAASGGLDLFAQSFFATLAVPLVGLLGRRAGGARVGRVSAWITALWPGGVLLSLSWLSEPLFVLLVAAACAIVAMARRRHRTRAFAAAAVVLSTANYVRPTALPILAVLAVGLAFAWSESHRGRAALLLRHAAIAMAIATLVHVPWMIRNERALGAVSLISTNGGSNLLLGTIGEGLYGPIPEDTDCPTPPRDEIERDRCRTALALDRIAAHPVDAVARGLVKVAHTFGYESSPAYAWARAARVGDRTRESLELWALAISRIAWFLLSGAALAGAALLSFRRTATMRVVLFGPAIAIALLHFATLGGDRYHAPAVPALAVLAAIALDAWRRAKSATRAS